MLSESTTGSAVVSLLPRSLIYGDIYVKDVHKFHESRETPTVTLFAHIPVPREP
jgi:hypothetical protein